MLLLRLDVQSMGCKSTKKGYILSLKRRKYTLGQRSRLAKVHLAKITREEQISKDDDTGLLEFYYIISDCLINFYQLNYESDINNSTDVLRQAIRRLPSKFYGR